MSRRKASDPALKKIVEVLCGEFKPTRLFLFGSRANGHKRADSDYDFVLVVKRMRGNRADNMIRASEATKHLGIKAEVFVYSETEFNEWKNELSSIPETALNTGKEIALG